MQKVTKEATNLQYQNKQPKNKSYYTFETRKLSLYYLECQKQYLTQKIDKVKVESYINTRELVRALSATNVNISTVKLDLIKESPPAMKALKDLRMFNEGIKTERQQHSLNYYKRITKLTQRQMRNILLT